MPQYDYICEVCKKPGRDYYKRRFCSTRCKSIGLAGISLRPVKWPITSEMHEQIKKLYRNNTGNGEVAEYAKRIGYPRWKITRYAVTHGWLARQKKEPDWSEKELKILEYNAHLSPEAIQRRLVKYGYKRTECAIVLKRKRMRFLKNLNGQSANSLALCFGTDVKFITRAIKHGKLKAKKRGTKRIERQGGDHYHIKDKDIRAYIIGYVAEIDFRKIDKYWLVDLLDER